MIARLLREERGMVLGLAIIVVVIIGCKEREHTQYPLLRHSGRGVDRRTGVNLMGRKLGLLASREPRAFPVSDPTGK
jgi:hypothetical protein